MPRVESSCGPAQAPRMLAFDWDGTLMDSDFTLDRALTEVLPRWDVGRQMLGELEPLLFRERTSPLGKYVMELCAGHRLMLLEIAHTEARLNSEARLFDGVLEMLEELHALGVQLTVITGRSRRGFEHALGRFGLSSLFAASVCAGEAAPKPGPQAMDRIFQLIGCRPQAYVGNAEVDARFAAICDCDFIPVHFSTAVPRSAALPDACHSPEVLTTRCNVLLGRARPSN